MNREFQVNRLSTEGIKNANQIAALYDALLDTVAALGPEGPEWTIAKRKLEESCFFAKKALSLNPKFQQAAQ